MNLDAERIRDKLDELASYFQELEEDIPESEEEYLRGRIIRRACERTFQLACEDILDICNLIISGKGWQIPKDNRDSVRRLAENRIISRELSVRVEDMISFRNLLVHRYGKVDDSRAYEYLRGEMNDIYEFIKAIEDFLINEDIT